MNQRSPGYVLLLSMNLLRCFYQGNLGRWGIYLASVKNLKMLFASEDLWKSIRLAFNWETQQRVWMRLWWFVILTSKRAIPWSRILFGCLPAHAYSTAEGTGVDRWRDELKGWVEEIRKEERRDRRVVIVNRDMREWWYLPVWEVKFMFHFLHLWIYRI